MASNISYLILLVSLCVFGAGAGRVNELKKSFTFECEAGKSLYHVVSQYSSKHQDRTFSMSCAGLPAASTLENCQWTAGFENHPKEVLHFQCPNNGVVAGVHSVYDGDAHDRKFQFKCCSPSGYVPHACQLSRWSNQLGGYQDVAVWAGHVTRGWTSVYDPKEKDRVYSVYMCRLGKLFDAPWN